MYESKQNKNTNKKGRIPETAKICLDKAGVKLDEKTGTVFFEFFKKIN